MNISFFNPSYLFFLPLALIPLIIHLFSKRKHKSVNYPETKFIKLAMEKSQKNLKLRQYLLIITRTLILMFLLFYFAKPVFQTGKAGGNENTKKSRSVVFMLDVSYSMGYDEAGKSKLENCILLAKKMMRFITNKDRVGVIVFSNRVEKATPGLLNDQEYINKFLDNVKITNRSTDIIPAFSVARELFSQVPESKKIIIVLSDMSEHVFKDKTEIDVSGCEVLYVYPESKANMWIKEFKSKYDENLGQWFFELSSEYKGKIPAAAYSASISIDGQNTGSDLLTYDNDCSASAVFSYADKGRETQVTASITNDRLMADNERFIIAKKPQQYNIWIVDGSPRFGGLTAESYFLRAALPQAKIVSETEVDKQILTPPGVVLLANIRKDHENISEFIRKGGGAVIFLGDQYTEDYKAEYLPCTIGTKIQKQSVVEWQTENSYLEKEISADSYESKNITVNDAYCVQPKRDAQVTAFIDSNWPFMLNWQWQQGKVVLFTASPTRKAGNLVGKPIFVPLIRAVCDYLSNTSAAKYKTEICVGQSFKYKYSQGLKVVSPSGSAVEYEKIGDEIAVNNTEETGFYTLYAMGEKAGQFAVNLEVGTGESDLTALQPKEIEKHFRGGRLVGFEENNWEKALMSVFSGKEISKILLLLVLLLLLFEVMLANPKYKNQGIGARG